MTLHQQLELEANYERLQSNMLIVLQTHGTSAQCRKCGEIVYRLFSVNRLNTRDYNADGMLHRHTCGKKTA